MQGQAKRHLLAVGQPSQINHYDDMTIVCTVLQQIGKVAVSLVEMRHFEGSKCAAIGR